MFSYLADTGYDGFRFTWKMDVVSPGHQFILSFQVGAYRNAAYFPPGSWPEIEDVWEKQRELMHWYANRPMKIYV